VRYTGISFVYQFSGIFASGITPLIATALLKTGGGQPWLICAYVVFAGIVSALSAWLIGAGRPPAEAASHGGTSRCGRRACGAEPGSAAVGRGRGPVGSDDAPYRPPPLSSCHFTRALHTGAPRLRRCSAEHPPRRLERDMNRPVDGCLSERLRLPGARKPLGS
jgi:hypothetical protein